ncbi:MAG: hypothetical protein J3K34DRAFT_81540 [Monoraphidium minutum]|nr:MAG: hypothetical protein J3K34DRAFT_81540 [Monoraphidium minutum]
MGTVGPGTAREGRGRRSAAAKGKKGAARRSPHAARRRGGAGKLGRHCCSEEPAAGQGRGRTARAPSHGRPALFGRGLLLSIPRAPRGAPARPGGLPVRGRGARGGAGARAQEARRWRAAVFSHGRRIITGRGGGGGGGGLGRKRAWEKI